MVIFKTKPSSLIAVSQCFRLLALTLRGTANFVITPALRELARQQTQEDSRVQCEQDSLRKADKTSKNVYRTAAMSLKDYKK